MQRDAAGSDEHDAGVIVGVPAKGYGDAILVEQRLQFRLGEFYHNELLETISELFIMMPLFAKGAPNQNVNGLS